MKVMNVWHLIRWGGKDSQRRSRTKLARQVGVNGSQVSVMTYKFEPWRPAYNGARMNAPRTIQKSDILHTWTKQPTQEEWQRVKDELHAKEVLATGTERQQRAAVRILVSAKDARNPEVLERLAKTLRGEGTS